jgi:hypothetical protein
MKRTKLRKKSKSQTKKLQDELWELCKQIIRKKYGNVCYTCGKENLKGSNWHTGHMIAKASLGAFLKYDLRVLRPQCYHCNVNLGGNGAEFYRRMVEIEGKKYVESIYKDKQILLKADELWYNNKIEEYKLILEELNGKTK